MELVPSKNRRIVDLAGQRFGKLLVCEFAGSTGKRAVWRCKCDCGKEKLVRALDLKTGATRSCGCLYKKPGILVRVKNRAVITDRGCWEWRTPRGGYAYTQVDGVKMPVHRAVYEQVRGPIPDGLEVCHNCPGGDNPTCCNPDHLWLGTRKENAEDAVRKGKVHGGEAHRNANLTNEQTVRAFEEFHIQGTKISSIARRLGVAPVIVSDIVHRKTWRRATQAVADRLGVSNVIYRTDAGHRVLECPGQLVSRSMHGVFLAGGISGCPDWQSEMIGLLQPAELTLFNPRRKEFPINDPAAARVQIEWEYRYLRKAAAVLFWFPCETLCPIVLYELGAWSMTKKPLFVGVHPEYKRRQDVEIQTRLVRHDVQVAYSLNDLSAQVLTWAGK